MARREVMRISFGMGGSRVRGGGDKFRAKKHGSPEAGWLRAISERKELDMKIKRVVLRRKPDGSIEIIIILG
jgi:hypothetical protein